MENGQEIIERNEEYIRITVSCFMRKCKEEYRGGMVSREDLMQEATLCFLAEVERYGEETAKAHRRTMIHSLWEAVRKAYPLSISYYGFGNGRRKPIQIEPLGDWAGRIMQADPADRVIDSIELKARLEGLSPIDRRIIQRRLYGQTQREIGQDLGLTDVQMCREMKRIKRQLERVQ